MLRRICPIILAYLLALLVVVVAFTAPEVYKDLTTATALPQDDQFDLSTLDVAFIVYIMAFITSVVPFVIARYWAAKYDRQTYKTALIAGVCVGLIAGGMTGLGLSMESWPILIAIFAPLGATAALCHLWLERRFVRYFSPIPQVST